MDARFMDGKGIRNRMDDRNMHVGGMFELVSWRDAQRVFEEII